MTASLDKMMHSLLTTSGFDFLGGRTTWDVGTGQLVVVCRLFLCSLCLNILALAKLLENYQIMVYNRQ